MGDYIPALRATDSRAIDSVDRSPEALASMSKLRRLATRPLIIWILAAFVVAIAAGLSFSISSVVFPGEWQMEPWNVGLRVVLLIFCVAIAFAYVGVALIEGRKPVEIMRKPVRFFGAGMVLGATLMCVSVGVVWLLGGIEFSGVRSHVDWWFFIWVMGLYPGIAEEVLMRGVLYRYLEQIFGTWAAIAVSGMVFGLLHLSNKDASLWGAVAIALEAGLLFGALYALFRSLWLVIGLHATWNCVQGGVFDVNVSGVGEFEGIFISNPAGNELISGGVFGIEASVVTVVLCSVVTVWAIVQIVRRGVVVPPLWGQQRAARQLGKAPAQ